MIPKFSDFMYTALVCLQDGEVRKNAYIYDWLKNHHGITDEEMLETVGQTDTLKAKGNMGWALTYLYQSGLLERPKKAHYKITELGLKELKDNKDHVIATKYLVNKYGKNSKFFGTNADNEETTPEEPQEQTPYELAISAINELNKHVVSDLLERVRQMNPQKFETLVVSLLVKMGYGGSMEDAASVTQYSKDEGIDGVIKEDKLGLESIYLQAKRWCEGNNVGRHEIQAFVGALVGKKANKGVFITTSAFTKEAIEYVKGVNVKVVLIDGIKLCQYMMQYELGVTTKEVLAIKKIDSDYFDEE